MFINNFIWTEIFIEYLLQYHPQAGGATERLNRTVKQLIQANIKAEKTWKSSFPGILEGLHSTPHSMTGKSSYLLMTGKNMRDSLAIIQPKYVYTHHVTDDLKKTVQTAQRKMCSYYDQKRSTKKHRFKVGDHVKIRLPQSFQKHKLSNK